MIRFDKSADRGADSQNKRNGGCGHCYTSMEECIHSRRCFITGEYCSKQTAIQKERNKLHKNDSIMAFVVMNFSDMSDVVYKWRLRKIIEQLDKYLYIDKSNKRLYCRTIAADKTPEGCTRVNGIQVVRSDSDPASNYVICSRICQQMQTADIIVVDVSSQNTNVFYEFGMAIAMGKLILPICYSESFYKTVVPEKLTLDIKKKKPYLEQHIGCQPWRKDLFEYYGILYKNKESVEDRNTQYIPFRDASDEANGFSDVKYNRFPYRERMEGDSKTIGERIYDKLRDGYNNADSRDNTLVVYTMDGFLNDEQAGRCIINFYHNITDRMWREQCFCGERVGVLVQENVIPESDKDAKRQLNLFYNVGEIIHIGVNQATYLALNDKIKTDDFLKVPRRLSEESIDIGQAAVLRTQKEGMISAVKEHIRNRGMMIYPNNPVYVSRVKNGLQKDILNDSLGEEDYESGSRLKIFCLYHVMLRTLRYTNEIVVDISRNCIQSLFWLGAAHGSDIYAITVLHEETEKEREITSGIAEKKDRNIFDVAGLWTAILHSNDTEGFYRQLSMAQNGIERHTKLMVKNTEYYEKSMREYLSSVNGDTDVKSGEEIKKEKQREESRILESYYRTRFWNLMLQHNRLTIYLPQIDNKDPKDKEPRLHTVKWDIDAIAALSYYLSKRTVIGEYRFKTLRKEQYDEDAERVNFICVGNAARPLAGRGKRTAVSLAEHIYGQLDAVNPEYGLDYNIIHRHWQYPEQDSSENPEQCNGKIYLYKGFVSLNAPSGLIFTQQAVACCSSCKRKTGKPGDNGAEIYHRMEEAEKAGCTIGENNIHTQLAQLILWREAPQKPNGRSYFRVAVTGCSGPATTGLASLFVDSDQKRELLREDENWEGEEFLCRLQEKIREKLMDIFLIRLEEALNSRIKLKLQKRERGKEAEVQKKRYFNLVKHAAAFYLSTVLYRYFLPFLSETDIKRIHNGMRTYISSMTAGGVSPFALDYPSDGDPSFSSAVSNRSVMEAAELVPKVLLSVLQGFRGVEAFYQVQVKAEASGSESSDTEQDTRRVLKIEALKDECSDTSSFVNCLFAFPDERK